MGESRAAKPLTVFLHIGTMKSGTSYLQSILKQNTNALQKAGVLFPPWVQQLNGVRELRTSSPDRSSWDAVLERLASWDGRAAIISVEGLSRATSEQAKQVVATLRPAKVQVIVTARDLARVLPSAWQTSLKNGSEWTLEEYAEGARDSEGSSSAGGHFWRRHDLVRIVTTWSEAVDDDVVDLVTVPPPGQRPELLWERFCSVVGLDPAAYDTTSVANSNPSLSLVEADVMRRVSAVLPDNLNHDRRVKIRKIFANEMLRGSAGGPVPTLPPESRDWITEHATNVVRQLTTSPINVTGDLSDLIPADPVDEPVAETTAADYAAEVAAVAVRAAGSVMLKLAKPNAPTAELRDGQEPGSRGDLAGLPETPTEAAARRARRRARRAARARKS